MVIIGGADGEERTFWRQGGCVLGKQEGRIGENQAQEEEGSAEQDSAIF